MHLQVTYPGQIVSVMSWTTEFKPFLKLESCLLEDSNSILCWWGNYYLFELRKQSLAFLIFRSKKVLIKTSLYKYVLISGGVYSQECSLYIGHTYMNNVYIKLYFWKVKKSLSHIALLYICTYSQKCIFKIEDYIFSFKCIPWNRWDCWHIEGVIHVNRDSRIKSNKKIKPNKKKRGVVEVLTQHLMKRLNVQSPSSILALKTVEYNIITEYDIWSF